MNPDGVFFLTYLMESFYGLIRVSSSLFGAVQLKRVVSTGVWNSSSSSFLTYLLFCPPASALIVSSPDR